MAIPPIVPSGLITSQIVPRKITYFFFTSDELSSYATWGLLLNVFLTLFGLAASAAVTCYIAQQPGLPESYVSKLSAYTSVLTVSAVIFAVISAVFIRFQSKAKNAMLEERVGDIGLTGGPAVLGGTPN